MKNSETFTLLEISSTVMFKFYIGLFAAKVQKVAYAYVKKFQTLFFVDVDNGLITIL
jgi:hypothetical protein